MSILQNYYHQALENLDDQAQAYFFGGAGDEISLNANLSAAQKHRILPSVLNDLRGGHTRQSLLGNTLRHPIVVAPIAYQKMAHSDGEIATAMAATAQNAQMVLSSQASSTLENTHNAGSNCDWFQLYWQVDKATTLRLVQRAQAAGYSAVFLTVDAPINGVRDREQQTGFRLPNGITAVNLADFPSPEFTPLGEGESAIFDRFMHYAPTWQDVEWLCAQTPLPVVLKGILRPSDARKAIDHGARGIAISNHGGRVLDNVPTPLDQLPAIKDVVGDTLPIFVDGGIRRGTDILIALALGANAVMVGRPIIWGLAANGAQGVSHVLRVLIDEFEVAMALAGCKTLPDITSDLLI